MINQQDAMTFQIPDSQLSSSYERIDPSPQEQVAPEPMSQNGDTMVEQASNISSEQEIKATVERMLADIDTYAAWADYFREQRISGAMAGRSAQRGLFRVVPRSE